MDYYVTISILQRVPNLMEYLKYVLGKNVSQLEKSGNTLQQGAVKVIKGCQTFQSIKKKNELFPQTSMTPSLFMYSYLNALFNLENIFRVDKSQTWV